MTVEFNCPSCQRAYRLKDEFSGRTIRCKECDAAVKVPGLGQANPPNKPTKRPTASRAVPSSSTVKKKSKPKKSQSKNSVVYWVIGGICGASVLMVLLCLGIGSLLRTVQKEVQEQAANIEQVAHQTEETSAEIPPPGDPTGLFPLASYPLPEFPALGNPHPVPDTSVQLYRVRFSNPQKSAQPAFNMQMNIYIPAGEHAVDSLSLVLVAPAGTPLFYGNSLDGDDYHDETLPYAEAGAVVIQYSLDGGLADSENATDAEVATAYRQFRNACAGLVNARCAIEYALQQIPAVDEKRIICAGHSSAGTLSALLAANEPRMAACITYCPCIDVEKRCKEVADIVGDSPQFPGMRDFLKQSSPKNHVNRIQCPCFLFHSRDDTNVEYSESLAYQELLKQFGKTYTFSQPDAFGDHYQPMIDEGIPRAIVWLKSQNLL